MFLRPEYPLGRLLALNASGEHDLIYGQLPVDPPRDF
jgi:hypothetical protein